MTCVRDMAWIGRCTGEPVTDDPPLCALHADDRCWCGAPAVRDCDVTMGLVCGRPLCADHDCEWVGHSGHGREQYVAWKAAR